MPTRLPCQPDGNKKHSHNRVPTLSAPREHGLGSTPGNPTRNQPSYARQLRNPGVYVADDLGTEQGARTATYTLPCEPESYGVVWLHVDLLRPDFAIERCVRIERAA